MVAFTVKTLTDLPIKIQAFEHVEELSTIVVVVKDATGKQKMLFHSAFGQCFNG